MVLLVDGEILYLPRRAALVRNCRRRVCRIRLLSLPCTLVDDAAWTMCSMTGSGSGSWLIGHGESIKMIPLTNIASNLERWRATSKAIMPPKEYPRIKVSRLSFSYSSKKLVWRADEGGRYIKE